MTRSDFNSAKHHSATRLTASLGVGLAVGIVVGSGFSWIAAPVAGWITASTVFLAWTWSVTARLDASRTALFATREDPTRVVSDAVSIVASIASLGAVALILIEAGSTGGLGAVLLIVAALVTIALSWFVVHTVFALRYAHLYYRGDVGGIDFNGSGDPQYSDFAYLAFTIGATFQVSDTNIQSREIRSTVLQHSLVSYLFGVVILATTINLVSGLAR